MQDTARKDLKRLADSKTLGHGYLLFGQDTQSAFTLAQELAGYLETKKWAIAERVLLDAMIVDGTKEKLGIEVSRSFSNFLYQQPVVSNYRTLIVNGAVDFTTEAQNALLKIVEEPPSHALIFFIVRDTNVFVPALRSRLQSIYIPAEKGLPAQAGAKSVLSPAQEQAKELVEKFLMSTAKGRSDIIKAIALEDKEVEKGEKVMDNFVTYLIEELAKKPEVNWRALKHLLKRQSAMQDLQTNKKLQLESVLEFIQ